MVELYCEVTIGYNPNLHPGDRSPFGRTRERDLDVDRLAIGGLGLRRERGHEQSQLRRPSCVLAPATDAVHTRDISAAAALPQSLGADVFA